MSARIHCTYIGAGDSTLFCEIRSPDDVEAETANLNRDLDRMKSWAHK